MGTNNSENTSDQQQNLTVEADDSTKTGFYVVGIGASAGGLEALEELFKNMPADTGMAFVVVSHQLPDHTSLLPELLGRCTSMPVTEAADGTVLAPDHVYINPPAACLGMMNGRLELMEKTPEEGKSTLPIDFFFRSLAIDQCDRAICIVLSGSGTDGSLGLRAVKGELGMAMVQDLESARFTGMPSSAIATSLADFILLPAAMPTQLLHYARGLARLRPVFEKTGRSPEVTESLQKIFMLLRERTGHDFSAYKQSTILRRIERRMAAHHLETPKEYVRLLRQSPHEIDLLFRELLIVVTSFFRDPEAFAKLREKVIPELMKQCSSSGIFRVWVAGCATGEEAYTIAILLHEAAHRLPRSIDVQIFATDLCEESVDYARQGRYPEGIASDVPAELLKRYFILEHNSYRVRDDIRKTLIFAQQNVTKDPPFTKIDMLCCRNLLIYLNADLQNRLLPIFHYALNPRGVLLLGPSETIGKHGELFETVDKKWKIFRKLNSPTAHRLPEIPFHTVKAELRPEQPRRITTPDKKDSFASQIQALLLNHLAPPSVLVNNRGDIVYIHGRTGDYLEPRAGHPRMNISDMAREGLSPALNSAMRQAMSRKKDVFRKRVRVKTNGDFGYVNLSVKTISKPETLRGLLLISFYPAPPPANEPEDSSPSEDSESSVHLQDLEREMQYTKESLQTAVEELKSSNEELQSSNEELQSTNEELETSKEELQSLNEELSTVNAELEGKVDELSHANDDMQNLLDSTNIATLYLDNALCIKRYTDQTRQIIKLIPSDLGRPVGDLVSNLLYDALEQDAREVLKTLTYRELEVKARNDRWYLMRIMPYRTAENLIDGLVVTFVDIGKTKQEEIKAQRSINDLKSIFDAFDQPCLVLDEALRVVSGNRTFYEVFETNTQKTVGQLLADVGGGEWENEPLRRQLREALDKNATVCDFKVEGVFPKIGRRTFLLNARKIERSPGLPGMILLSFVQKKTEGGCTQ